MFGMFKRESTPPPVLPPLPPSSPPPLPPLLPSGPPRAHHREFTHEIIPDVFITGDKRDQMLMKLVQPDMQELMRGSWDAWERLSGQPASSSKALELSAFRHENCIISFWEFPRVRYAGEAILGLLVVGPAVDWKAVDWAKLPVRYFVLERGTEHSTTIFEWSPSGFVLVSPGPRPGRPITVFCDMVLDHVFGKQRPTAQDTARRLLVLEHLVVYSQASAYGKQLHQCPDFPPAAKADLHTIMGGMFSKGLRELGLWEYVSPREREFLACPVQELKEQQVMKISWRYEAIGILIWALRFIPELPAYDSQVSHEILKPFQGSDPARVIQSAQLRDQAEIDRAREIAELWNWRNRTRQLMVNGYPFEPGETLKRAGVNTYEDVIRMTAQMAAGEGDLPAPIGDDFAVKGKAYRDLTEDEWAEVRSISTERHFTLNWLCGYAPGNNWDNTPTET
ncbi:MAG: DUF4272 domain-containing protein [Verrucomicrobia bacterium]|nr:DUF4272 domain-containing protein [Verrucomicrobiota bacterium]